MQERTQGQFSSTSIRPKLHHQNLSTEFDWLEEFLNQLNSPIVFGHGDIQPRNLMMSGIGQDGTQSTTLIDFEFSGYNRRGYDIGCYFAEWTLEYPLPDFPHFSLDLSILPDIDSKRAFAIEYLNTSHKLSQTGKVRTEAEIAEIINEGNSFVLAYFFFIIIWALQACYVGDDPDLPAIKVGGANVFVPLTCFADNLFFY